MKMFSGISQVFPFKKAMSIEKLKIIPEKINLIIEAKLDIKNLSKDDNNNVIISDPLDKLNIKGAHFASVYVQNKDMGKPRFDEIIYGKINSFKKELDKVLESNLTLKGSSDSNPAYEPKWEVGQNFFCSRPDL